MAAATRYKTTDLVDFVIVGSGAAGGVLAKELSSTGFRVVVLEQGPRLKPGDFEHDEYWAFNLNALTNNWREQPNTFRNLRTNTVTQLRSASPQSQVFNQGAVMRNVLQEVLAANQRYAADFGDKAALAMPPTRRDALPFSLAWMRGLIPPSSPG